jgi:TolC family type I secretion outer membrane protein
MIYCKRRLRPRLLAATALAGLSLAVALPSAADAETLKEALADAYATNPDLKAARRQLGATNERVPQALSNWRPEVSITGSAGRQKLDQEGEFTSTDGTTSPLTAQFEVSQPLYRGGRTVAGTERAENEVRAERARLAGTEQDVLLRGVQAYVDVWRDQAVLGLNDNNVKVLRRQLEATQDRFTVGEVTRTDVAQAESRLSRAIADREAARGQLESSRAAYVEVIGHPPEDLEQPPIPDILPGTLDGAKELAVGNNPNVVANRFNEGAARRQVREVAGELLPEAELVGRLSQRENTTTEDSSTQSAEILAQVTIPLYQQGAVFSRVREAKQTANQRRLEVRSAERTAEQQAVSAWEDLQAARAQIESFREQVRAADIALEGVRQENQVGARTVLDVLDAEQELLDAQVSLVRAQRDGIFASHQLLSAIGKLRARALGLPVEYYDVESGYNAVRDKIWGWGIPNGDDDGNE